MDNKLHQEAVKDATRAKFRGKRKIRSRYIPLYPDSSEREMRRIANGYMKIVTAGVKEALPDVIRVYEQEVRKDSRMDGIRDLRSAIRNGFSKARESIAQKLEEYGLEEKLARTAVTVKNTALNEWKKTVKKTLNVTLLDDYYRDELYRKAIDDWIKVGSDAMHVIPTDLLDKIQQIIEDGYSAGKPVSEIKKEVQHAYSVKRREVVDGAAGSVSTLNYECTRVNQEDAGVREYMWYTRRDARVRPCHASLDGKYFRWDGPPEMWYQTIHEGKVWTGRYCHPGQDYNCRCRAVPRFDIQTLNLPITGGQEGG